VRGLRRYAIAGLIAAGVAASPRAAAAQDPDPIALEDQAYQDFAAGRLAEALRGYQRVYELAPRAEVLFAIGNLQQRLGQCDRAIATLEDYLAGDVTAGAAKARELIAGCRATLAPAAVVEEPGDEPAPPPVAEVRTDRDRAPGRGRRRAALVFGGVAVIGTGAAITAELVGRSYLHAYAIDRRESEFDTANRYHYLAQGVAIASGGCAVAAAYLWITGRHRADAGVAVAPIAGGAVVSWSGGF
jgi:tetratricopeptide (TPR) repeat protein